MRLGCSVCALCVPCVLCTFRMSRPLPLVAAVEVGFCGLYALRVLQCARVTGRHPLDLTAIGRHCRDRLPPASVCCCSILCLLSWPEEKEKCRQGKHQKHASTTEAVAQRHTVGAATLQAKLEAVLGRVPLRRVILRNGVRLVVGLNSCPRANRVDVVGKRICGSSKGGRWAMGLRCGQLGCELGVHHSCTSRECHARAEHIFTPFCVPGSLPPLFHQYA